jgi:hypothetical protein
VNLDELLASLNSAAHADLSALPLLDAADYAAASPRGGVVSAQAADVYVGCFGWWLIQRDAFVVRLASQVAQARNSSLSPATISTDIMAGRLMAEDVAEGYREFVTQYTRELMVYASDYVETLVVPRLLRDMFDVRDAVENAQAVASVIDERYRRYLDG